MRDRFEEEAYPIGSWGGGRYTGECAEEVGIKGADVTFGGVAAVDIGGDKLVCGLPDVSDVATVLLSGFVFEDLVVNDVAALLEAGHDAGVCGDTVAILVGLEGFNEDDIGVAKVNDHELLVAAAGAEW